MTRAARARIEAARDDAAGALHRGLAHQGARAARHRPSVDLRADHRRRSSAAATSSGRARRSCRASRRSPSRGCCATHFGDLVDVEFTAEMEEDLDQISRGEREWLDFIEQFYRGDAQSSRPRAMAASRRSERRLPDDRDRRRSRVGRADSRAHRPVRSVRAAWVRAGRARRRRCRRRSRAGRPDRREGDGAGAAKAEGPRPLGVDPERRQNVYVHPRPLRRLRAAGRDTAAEKGVERQAEAVVAPRRPHRVDGHARGRAQAAQLPRDLGPHPADGEPVVAGLGRFGPYVKHGDDFRSLESEGETLSRSRCDARCSCSPRRRSRRRTVTRAVLRTLGAHPQGGAEVKLMEGRYGPLRHRRIGERVGAAGGQSRRADARGGGRVAEGKGRGRAVEAAARRTGSRQTSHTLAERREVAGRRPFTSRPRSRAPAGGPLPTPRETPRCGVSMRTWQHFMLPRAKRSLPHVDLGPFEAFCPLTLVGLVRGAAR